jgi:hypothetical protein
VSLDSSPFDQEGERLDDGWVERFPAEPPPGGALDRIGRVRVRVQVADDLICYSLRLFTGHV